MKVTEKFLQFVWQYQHFNQYHLATTAGSRVFVIHPGILNTDQGPDFLDARIKIGDEEWVGSVELHVMASSWEAHNHSADKFYKNVILHVVWKEDVQLDLAFPTVELESRVPGAVLSRYDLLMQSPQFIPCQESIKTVPEITLNIWKQALLVERLQQRAVHIFKLLEQNKYHWEETFWWLLAAGFGYKLNSNSFLKIAQQIPYTVIVKHRNQLHHLEALLLGQAGILDTDFEDKYPQMLSKEYRYLAQKYKLQKTHYPLLYLRMRPAGFPPVRLAQLAALIHAGNCVFSNIIEQDNLKNVAKLFNIQANDYWHYHYIPGRKTAFCIKKPGSEMIHGILINTIIPVLYAYGKHQQTEGIINKCFRWLEELKGEKNVITRHFAEINVESKTAFDSQALIQMKNEYCNHKRCLECAVGYKLLYSAL